MILLWVLAIVAQLADLLVTERNVTRGHFGELNPIARTRTARIVVKVVLLAVFIVIVPLTSPWLLIFPITAGVMFAGWNQYKWVHRKWR